MDTILDFFGMSKLITSKRGDDDRIDRLNRKVTVTMLIFFSIIVTTKTFVGEPIYCWSPNEFDGTQPDYVNSYCWIRNTYSFSQDHLIADLDKIKGQNKITYYQWVPLILLIQAMFFYLPYVFWKSCSGKSGLDLNSIVVAGESFLATETAEVRDKTISYMISQMDRYLAESKKNYYRSRTISFKQILSCCTCLRGCYLFSFYLLVKCVYLLNALLQFIALNLIFGNNFYSFGIDIIRNSMKDESDFLATRQFPRTTMCDLKIRRLANLHDYKVQCILPINHFNEKIFLMLWFWFLIVTLVTFLSLVAWLKRMYPKSKIFNYTYRHLKYASVSSDDEDTEDDDDDDDDEGTFRKQVKQFVDYLNRDGVFVVKMLATNADTITATDFVYALFSNFRNKNIIKNSRKNSKEIELKTSTRKRNLCCTKPKVEDEEEMDVMPRKKKDRFGSGRKPNHLLPCVSANTNNDNDSVGEDEVDTMPNSKVVIGKKRH